ncbi:MAG TPA: MBL fold metallo-hydrolase [Gammaproteobacteria bacterium]|nr:MBL fold metallo-hydrolase [Gammaproteobacteria bacterium]
MRVNRRTVLQGALGAAVAASIRPVFAKAAAITDELTLLGGFGGNVVALKTSDGAVLVDSGVAMPNSPLLALTREATGTEHVHTLFNTHWHHEQIGGNEALGTAGAHIVAHEKTRLRLATPYFLPERDEYQPAMPVKAQPTESFYTTGSTTIGGRRIEYGYLPEAHTDGDAYVYFRDDNVIAVGDALAPERDVELDWYGGGWLGGRVDSLKKLLELTDAQTKFVPSYGAPVGRAAVQAEHDMCNLLFERFFERVRKGETPEDMLAAGIMKDTGRTWSDPAKFVHDTSKGFWGHNNTLSHDIV